MKPESLRHAEMKGEFFTLLMGVIIEAIGNIG